MCLVPACSSPQEREASHSSPAGRAPISWVHKGVLALLTLAAVVKVAAALLPRLLGCCLDASRRPESLPF